MRVRTFFWVLLILVSLGVVCFAAYIPRDLPAVLQINLDQQPIASVSTSMHIHFTDPEGQPIEQARINSQVEMTNMPMQITPPSIRYQGNGTYTFRVQFNMAGPWAITVTANAHGFNQQQRTLIVDVI